MNGFLSDRFLYGSSYPFIGVKAYAEWFRTLPIRPEVMDDVLHRNAARFLDLEGLGFPLCLKAFPYKPPRPPE